MDRVVGDVHPSRDQERTTILQRENRSPFHDHGFDVVHRGLCEDPLLADRDPDPTVSLKGEDVVYDLERPQRSSDDESDDQGHYFLQEGVVDNSAKETMHQTDPFSRSIVDYPNHTIILIIM